MDNKELFTTLKATQSVSIDKALDLVFNEVEDALINEEFKLCDEFIKLISNNIDEFEIEVIIGLLTVTLGYIIQVPSRVQLFIKTKDFIEEKMCVEEAEQILIGL